MKAIVRAISVVAIALSSALAGAEPTRELYIEGRKEVFEGDPISTRLTAHAEILVGLQQRGVVDGLDAAVTAVTRGGDGVLYVGTAGKGLLRVPQGANEAEAVTDEGIVTALAPIAGGVLFTTADDGQVRRVRRGEVEAFVLVEARYVWGLAVEGDRAWAVTGEPGTLVELREGEATVRFEADEAHLRSVATNDGALLFGGGEKGIVYRWERGEVRALYDSAFDETTSLAWDRESGDVFAGFASAEEKASLPAFKWIGAVGGESDGDDDSPFRGSELVRIDERGRVDVLWRAQGEGLMDLAVGDMGVIFSTGGGAEARGRIYRAVLDAQDRLELVARVDDPLVPAFTQLEDGSVVAGTGGSGRLVRFGPRPASSGEYRSTEQDFQRVGRIGRLWFDAEIPKDGRVALSIRTGNTSEVDATWSDWSEPVSDPRGGAIDVPAARYAQFRLELKAGARGASPVVRSMHGSVVRLNDPPQVHEIFPLQRDIALEPLPTDTDQDKTLTLSSSVLDKLRSPSSNGEDRVRVRQNFRPGHRTIAWHASDTNGDELMYAVEIGDGEGRAWTEVARGLSTPFWSFDSRAYPDGRYAFRISASDRPSNHPRDALTTRSESPPVLIDNTAPVLSGVSARVDGAGRITVTARVKDATSPVVEAHVAVDGGPWLMMPAADGLVDAREETLQVELAPDEMGPTGPEQALRAVSVRVRDDAGNEATRSVSLRLP
jgi:hypothetical protein